MKVPKISDIMIILKIFTEKLNILLIIIFTEINYILYVKVLSDYHHSRRFMSVTSYYIIVSMIHISWMPNRYITCVLITNW